MIDNPWALTDRQFAYCIFVLKTDRDPDPDKIARMYPNEESKRIAERVEKEVISQAWKVVEAGLAAYGGKAIGAARRIKKMTIVGLALDLLKDYLMTKLANWQRANLLARYRVDEARRLYLATKGLSSYKAVDVPAL